MADGGFLVPDKYYVKRKGILAWFYRLFNDPRGWEVRSYYEELLKAIENGKYHPGA